MAAITNWALAMHQQKHVYTEQDLDKFNKTADALKYTPYVDVALCVIFSLGSMLASHMGLAGVGVALLVVAFVFSISAVAFRRSDSFEDLVRAVNRLWYVQRQREAFDARFNLLNQKLT